MNLKEKMLVYSILIVLSKDYDLKLVDMFSAPLAVGQRAYVMVRCPSSVRPSVR